MNALPERGESRRAANARKRVSRRPSRLGLVAGATLKPDRVREADAGFPGLLKRAWQRAEEADDLRSFVEVLLTLDGHVPADVQLRALSAPEEAALATLCGLTWRTQETTTTAADAGADGDGGPEPVFLGEIALATSGRVVLRVPSQAPLKADQLVGGVRRVPWTQADLDGYREYLRRAEVRVAETVADCRRWLDAQGPQGRDALLEQAKEAALRTAPFVLYQQGRQYTNFRDHNTLTGKTLWPGHPDCALSSLQGLPLELWSDHDAQLLVCLTLLVRSAGPGRVEEANGTQLTVDHLAHMLERIRLGYNAALGREQVPPAASTSVADLNDLAVALRTHRAEVAGHAQLYREIHGALMHKIEKVARPYADAARAREDAVVARLTDRLPLTGDTLQELGRELAAAPHWLAAPHGDFATGLEALVYASAGAATEAFDADFAMSRGMRSLPDLISALREERWAEICDWEITRFFCCVVPDPSAARHFGGSTAALADAAWAMSSRMQYNSWHFIAGNLPKGPEVVDRDHFVPPTIPDVAFYSDQHHHGHVNNNVRFSIRSPQSVVVDGRRFNGFVDLRLLRCDGTPFDEQDLLAAHRVSAFTAQATGLAAELAAAGEEVEVTAFDSPWHWSAVTGQDKPASRAS
ncbi:hypothetical protein SAM23877_7494 [Streptomyces ambofaciens ATCC 23877]|nr:hypothetical protein [Streptomyces ambofaciens]AKZ60535.1 hypothetical protein SAM23877_7494 [Streptomyces ambofaciens ATCC 23877]CAI78078.1 unknown hypothetical protein [Streptomyces ambofaciens ATCC 23877]CAI78352.1 unknown hypothetical protein [Streptomyces ambofaciens ATCC 23877]CAJ87857.1 hypothetical protein SAMT0148 [Streptomyces ambofaciens ATCC 23877]CAJ89135.1 hypothetical protein SAMT0148 [Streptomyces ambofaciens ATCC 23877]